MHEARKNNRVKKLSYQDFQRWFLMLSLAIFVGIATVLFVSTEGHAEELPEASSEASLEEPTEDQQAGTAVTEGSTQARVSTKTSPKESTDTQTESSTMTFGDRVSLNYFAIFYGPSVGEPSSYQATPTGERDENRPLLVKNYLSAGYRLSDYVSASATGYWAWRPVLGQQVFMRDPYVRIGHSSLINSGNFNLYADARLHFPITAGSREMDMLAGLQTFQMATYQLGASRWTLGLYGSARFNVYGVQGIGNPDLELYIGPNVNYQVSRNLALTLLYEMGTTHYYGDDPMNFYSEGSDLEPGLSWDITPRINVNPYLTIYTGEKISFDTTAFGMTLSLSLL